MVPIWPRSVFDRSHDIVGPKICDSIAQHKASGPVVGSGFVCDERGRLLLRVSAAQIGAWSDWSGVWSSFPHPLRAWLQDHIVAALPTLQGKLHSSEAFRLELSMAPSYAFVVGAPFVPALASHSKSLTVRPRRRHGMLAPSRMAPSTIRASSPTLYGTCMSAAASTGTLLFFACALLAMCLWCGALANHRVAAHRRRRRRRRRRHSPHSTPVCVDAAAVSAGLADAVAMLSTGRASVARAPAQRRPSLPTKPSF